MRGEERCLVFKAPSHPQIYTLVRSLSSGEQRGILGRAGFWRFFFFFKTDKPMKLTTTARFTSHHASQCNSILKMKSIRAILCETLHWKCWLNTRSGRDLTEVSNLERRSLLGGGGVICGKCMLEAVMWLGTEVCAHDQNTPCCAEQKADTTLKGHGRGTRRTYWWTLIALGLYISMSCWSITTGSQRSVSGSQMR